MFEQEDDPRLKELLRQVEDVYNIPDYPDWKRGWKWGLPSGIIAGAIVALFLLSCGRLLQLGWSAALFAFAVFLVVWAVGAFRPQKF